MRTEKEGVSGAASFFLMTPNLVYLGAACTAFFFAGNSPGALYPVAGNIEVTSSPNSPTCLPHARLVSPSRGAELPRIDAEEISCKGAVDVFPEPLTIVSTAIDLRSNPGSHHNAKEIRGSHAYELAPSRKGVSSNRRGEGT